MNSDPLEEKLLLPRTVPLRERVRTEEERVIFERINTEKILAEQKVFEKFPDPEKADWSAVQEFIREHLAYVAGRARAFSWQYRDFRVGAALSGLRRWDQRERILGQYNLVRIPRMRSTTSRDVARNNIL